MRVICPDPPWWYAEMPKKNGGVTYPLMKLSELVALKPLIDEWAGDEPCALPMWFTGPHFPTAMALGEAWGFQWVTMLLTWCKTSSHDPNQACLFPEEMPDFNVYPGSGRYTKHGTEFVGLWRRGSLPKVADKTIRQVIHAPVQEHSRKPDEAYQRIEALWPDAWRMEMFARCARPGWEAWGNQVEKFGTVTRA